jgi:adenylate cyclase class 2
MDNQEREIKLYIQNLPALAERLRICGADCVRERTLERNLRLDMSDGSLQKAGRLLRLREDDGVRVAYKDHSKMEDGIVVRREIEFTADNLENALKLFKALGYEVIVSYEKYRSVYQLGDVVVALDELPYGDFIEIEAPNNTLIEGVAGMLGLDRSKAVDTNYLGLFERLKKKPGIDSHDLIFENFRGVEVSPNDMNVEPADMG